MYAIMAESKFNEGQKTFLNHGRYGRHGNWWTAFDASTVHRFATIQEAQARANKLTFGAPEVVEYDLACEIIESQRQDQEDESYEWEW